jgi:hypothetical protein
MPFYAYVRTNYKVAIIHEDDVKETQKKNTIAEFD